MTWWSAGPSCPTAKWTEGRSSCKHVPRQRKNRQAPGLVSVRTAVVLTLALAVGAVTAMLENLAHEGPARIALTSLGAVGAAVLFFHTVIDAD